LRGTLVSQDSGGQPEFRTIVQCLRHPHNFCYDIAHYLPLPLRLTDCGPYCALSKISKEPRQDSLASGANVTPISHFAPGSSVGGQLFVTLNLIKGPLRRSPCIVTVKPGFFLLPAGLRMVTYRGPFSRPALTMPKSSDFGVISNVTGTVAAERPTA
jgi:hypothetical protein